MARRALLLAAGAYAAVAAGAAEAVGGQPDGVVAFDGNAVGMDGAAECQELLKAVEGRSDLELAALCRARLPPESCRSVMKALGGRPWEPESMANTCRALQAEQPVRDLLASGRSLEVARWLKSDKGKHSPLDSAAKDKPPVSTDDSAAEGDGTSRKERPWELTTTPAPKESSLDSSTTTKKPESESSTEDESSEEGGKEWLVTNSKLKVTSDGLGYRSSKSLKAYTAETAPWGSTVDGTKEGNWIQVEGKGYLPMKLDGSDVVVKNEPGKDDKNEEEASTTTREPHKQKRHGWWTGKPKAKKPAKTTTEKAAEKGPKQKGPKHPFRPRELEVSQKWDAGHASTSAAGRLLEAVPWAVGTGIAFAGVVSLASFAGRAVRIAGSQRTMSRLAPHEAEDETTCLVRPGYESEAEASELEWPTGI